MNALKPTQLRKLGTVLRLLDRPSLKADYINKIVAVPMVKLLNMPHFIKTAAKPLSITRSDNKIMLKFFEAKRGDIVYTQHTATERLQRVTNAMQRRDLHTLTATELAAVHRQNQNR